MKSYLDLIESVLTNGMLKPNRTGIDTIAIKGYTFEHDMRNGFPLLTTKKIKFENEDCQSLFNTIRDLVLSQKEIDIVSIYQTNQNIKAIEISKISTEYIHTAHLPAHIESLKDKKYKSELLKIIDNHNKIINTGVDAFDLDEMRNGLIADLSTLTRDDKSEFENISYYKKQIEEHLNSKSLIEGFSWDISDLDRWTSGIVLPRVYVIGGLKKSGKTRFLIHTIKALLKQNVPNVFLSMEMPAYEVTKLLPTDYDLMIYGGYREEKTQRLYFFANLIIFFKLYGFPRVWATMISLVFFVIAFSI